MTPDTYAEQFEERAAIAEHDAGLSRERAETLALRMVQNRWTYDGEPCPWADVLEAIAEAHS